MESTFNESSSTPWKGPDVEYIQYYGGGTPPRHSYWSLNPIQLSSHRAQGSKGGKFIPGELKLRAFSVRRTRYFPGIGSETRRSKANPEFRSEVTGHLNLLVGGLPTADYRFPASPSSLPSIALTKAMSKFQASGEDLGEFLAELPESIGMIHSGISSVVKTMRKARKGGFSWSKAAQALKLLRSGTGLKRLPKDLSQSWLTWRYGIRPMFWDVLMLCRLAGEKVNLHRRTGLLRKTAQESYNKSISDDLHISHYGVVDYYTKVYWTTEARAKATVYYRLLEGVNPRFELLRYYGLHPQQIPSLLWELTPLSFVVDWFTNVGEFVSALVPRPDVRVEGYSVSTKITRTMESAGSSKNTSRSGTSSLYTYEVEVPRDKFVSEALNRTVGGSIPNLTVRIKPEILLSIQQKADLVTLVTQKWLNNHRRS